MYLQVMHQKKFRPVDKKQKSQPLQAGFEGQGGRIRPPPRNLMIFQILLS
jgi:hypothetical protein